MRIFSKSILLIFCLGLFSSKVLAQETFINAVPLGNGKSYMCIDTNLGNLYVAKLSSAGLTAFNPSPLINKLKIGVNSLKLKVRNGTATTKDKNQLKIKKILLADLQKCLANKILNDLRTPCGVVSGKQRSASPRIIEGDFCADSGTPFLKISIYDQENQRYTCTANIIAPNMLLTAAHCVDFNPSALEAREGSSVYSASSYLIHPSYQGNIQNKALHDLALIRFDGNVFKRTPVPINGSSFLHVSPGESVLIGGYGLDENSTLGNLKAGTMFLDDAGNFGIYSLYSSDDGYPDSNTCQGDSGGPLLARRSGKWTLTGLTSWGSNSSCGVDGNPDDSYFANLLDRSNVAFIKTNVPKAKFLK